MTEDRDHLLDRARVNAGRASEDLDDALAAWRRGTFSHQELLVRVTQLQTALLALARLEA